MSAAWRVVAVALGAAVVGTFALAAPAAAHVTIDPTSAPQGGIARLALRVPSESDTASTTKVQVYLPENAPVAAFATAAVPGWTATVERRKLDKPIEVHGAPVDEVPSVVTWTATGPDTAIRPGQFGEFPVSIGPLPTVDTMVFKTLQTYSDGTIVRWIDETGMDGKEPEHPAPVLRLTRTDTSAPAAAATPDSSGSDRLPVALSIAALVAGLGGLVLGGLAFARVRRRPD